MSYEVRLTRGLVTIVDDIDRPIVEPYRWYAQSGREYMYAARAVWKGGVRQLLLLHRVIVSAPEGVEVDHINGDTLNNVRSNLRLATHAQNMANARLRVDNTSGFHGVAPTKLGRPWRAYVAVNGRHVHVGKFDTAVEAARARDVMARQVYGPFARLNFP